MRSCKYLITANKEENKRTNILRLRTIQFKKNNINISHHSTNITFSDLFIITFEFQKNNKRNKAVHMFKTNDEILCPAEAWAYTITLIRMTVPGAGMLIRKYVFIIIKDKLIVDSSYARAETRGIVDIIGEEILGFTKEYFGLHSIRSGGAVWLCFYQD